MKITELDFEYPKELVATEPANPRDAARLLVLDKKNGEISETVFASIGNFLKKGDVLVFNKTKVFPARITGIIEGSEHETVFLSEIESRVWEVLIRGQVTVREEIRFGEGLSGTILAKAEGLYRISVNLNKEEVLDYLFKYGKVPLPPYIKREAVKSDEIEYQTIFAEHIGSAAAPTAGLHFTEELIESLRGAGIQIEFITLHVGIGTFAPVKTEIVEEHPIHEEYFEIDDKASGRILAAKKEGRRIIAVGTTSVRALESSGGEAYKGKTKLFIYPGYNFRIVSGMITNFHTPRSSLLALVFALAGKENIQNAYRVAISKKYRLFSYGDGMFIQ